MTFVWTDENQKSLNSDEDSLTNASVLGYPDFARSFLLVTDTLMKGLGVVLSQKDENGISRVIASGCRSLKPNEKSMKNYSSAGTLSSQMGSR